MEINKSEERHKHNYTIDFVRVFAILLVIANHCLDSCGGQFNLQGKSLILVMAFYVICRLGVPLFFMISGFLLLSKKYDKTKCKKFYLHNLLPLWITFVVWVVIYNIFSVAIGNEFCGVGNLITEIFLLRYVGSVFIQEWYMPVILLLYVLTPFIANALNSISIKYIIFACCFILVYFFIFSTSSFAVNNDITYFLYFTLGFLANKYYNRQNKLDTKRNVILNIIIILLTYVVTIICLISEYRRTGEAIFVWYTCPALPIIAFSLFLLFLDVIKIKRCLFLKKVSTCCFGVYLVHNIFIIIFPHIFTINNFVLYLISQFAFVSVVSFGIVFLISLIPYVRKIVFRIK